MVEMIEWFVESGAEYVLLAAKLGLGVLYLVAGTAGVFSDNH